MSDQGEDVCYVIPQIIAEVFQVPVSDLLPETSLEDLGGDSLDRIDLVMSLEERFGLEISDEQIDRFKTVGGVLAYVESRL